MENKYIVSVIIPVFNAGLYIKQCLDSLLNQSFRDFKVICVDDGSTDNSVMILKQYAKRDSGVYEAKETGRNKVVLK